MTAVMGIILGALALAGPNAHAASPPTLFSGQWGGEHVMLSLDVQGGHLTLDCGSGDFPPPQNIDKHGNFSVVGTLEIYRPGPTNTETATKRSKALYEGKFQNNLLTLQVTLSEKRYHYNLTRGARTKFVRCL